MRHIELDLDSGCWVWTGATAKGYGRVKHYDKVHQAHRLSYERWRGPIPDGLELDHTCRNHACINPSHVEPRTSGQNHEHTTARSGIRGVTAHRNRWQAQVRVDKKYHYLGLYDTAEEAGEVAAEFRRTHMTNSLLDRRS